MSPILAHWSFDPFLIVVGAVVAVHGRGLHHLVAGRHGARVRARWRQALCFYAGLAVLVVAVCSPVDYWADSYFFVHMIQHLLLMFAAPPLIVVGAPWLPLEHGLPAGLRRTVSRSVLHDRWSAPLRQATRSRWWPFVGVVGLNAVVVFWHLPGPFDLAERNQAIHVWLMHGSFFAFGMLFWLQLINSRPLRIRQSPPAQMASIFSTAVVMWVLAIALSLCSRGSWYPWYQAHEGAMLPAFADQQIGAGIMWTCGIFWAVPAMIVAIRRLIDQSGADGLEAVLDDLVRGARHRGAAGRRGGHPPVPRGSRPVQPERLAAAPRVELGSKQ